MKVQRAFIIQHDIHKLASLGSGDPCYELNDFLKGAIPMFEDASMGTVVSITPLGHKAEDHESGRSTHVTYLALVVAEREEFEVGPSPEG